MYEDILKEIGKNAGYLLIGLLVVFIAYIKKIIQYLIEKLRGKKELDVSKIGHMHSVLHDILTEIRVELKAARVYIIQFHNGEYFSNGTPILKFSITHESCNLEVSRHKEDVSGMLLSMNYDLIKIIEKEENEIYYTKDLEEGVYKSHLMSKNTLAFVYYPIKYHKNYGNTVGILCIDWCSSEKISNIDINKINAIKLKYFGLVQNLVNKQRE